MPDRISPNTRTDKIDIATWNDKGTRRPIKNDPELGHDNFEKKESTHPPLTSPNLPQGRDTPTEEHS